MTKAAHLHSSPHLDWNKTYLGPSLTSSSATALWQPHCFGTMLFELCQETGRSWLFGCQITPCVMDALDRRGGRRDRRKMEVKYQFSCLKWSVKWYFAGAQLRTPAKVPLGGAHPCYTWYWHWALPHTQNHIRAAPLFEREMGGTVRPLTHKKVYKARQEYIALLQIIPSKGAGKWSRVPTGRWRNQGLETFPCAQNCSQTAGQALLSLGQSPAC